jgi:hypothetical protein
MMFVTVQLDILGIRVMNLNIPNVMSISPIQLYTRGAMEKTVKLTFTQSKVSIPALSLILLKKQACLSFFNAEQLVRQV